MCLWPCDPVSYQPKHLDEAVSFPFDNNFFSQKDLLPPLCHDVLIPGSFGFVYKLKDLSSTDSFSGNCVQTPAHPRCLAPLPPTCGAANIKLKSHSHFDPEVLIVEQL